LKSASNFYQYQSFCIVHLKCTSLPISHPFFVNEGIHLTAFDTAQYSIFLLVFIWLFYNNGIMKKTTTLLT